MSDARPNDDIRQSGVFETPPDVADRVLTTPSGDRVVLRRAESLPTLVRRFDYIGTSSSTGERELRFFCRAGERSGRANLNIQQIGFRAKDHILTTGMVEMVKNGNVSWSFPVERLVKCFDAAGLFEQATRLQESVPVQPNDRFYVRLRMDDDVGPLTVTCYLVGEQYALLDRL